MPSSNTGYHTAVTSDRKRVMLRGDTDDWLPDSCGHDPFPLAKIKHIFRPLRESYRVPPGHKVEKEDFAKSPDQAILFELKNLDQSAADTVQD